MKILWLAPMPLLNNTGTHPAPWIISLAKALVEDGNELTIINNNAKIDNDILTVEYEKIKIIYIKTPKLKFDLVTLYKFKIHIVKKYLKKIIHDFDILHIHGTEHQYEAMSDGLNIKKVISIQGIMGEYIKCIPIKRYKQFLEWKLSSIYESKYLIKNNNYSCRTHWDSSYIKAKNSQAKIYMIWEMIRKDFFSNHYSLEKENILFVGGKNPIKGLKELLQAYNDSLQELGFKLIVLGNCTKGDVSEFITKLALKNIDLKNIDCRGMQNSTGMIKAYEESYCLVHPTYIDNSPNSVCEAQLSGLPVIATDVGGVSSLIENEKTGLLIGRESNDIEFAVSKLINNDKLRNSISEESRIISRKRHNKNEILEQTISMYKNIIYKKDKDVI